MRSEHKNLWIIIRLWFGSGWANVQEQAIEKGRYFKGHWGTAGLQAR